MYESYFGLKQKAFNLTPDPDFLYLNERTKKAFEEILYGIARRDGFAVIVGDVGTGKTTLSCALLQKIEREKNIRTVLIQNPMLPEVDMLRAILQDLGVRPDAAWPENVKDAQVPDAGWTRDLTKKELIDHLNTFLAERAREDVFTVLIIDESQNLSLEMLEQLRLLSNLETTKKKLLQIIFLGQLEFDRKLAELRQLDQRVSVRFETQALSREDTEKYIRHRLLVAGGTHGIQFGRGAVRAIHRHSRGYPRLINMICDRSLKEAFRERSFTVTRQMVHDAAVGFARKRNPLLAWSNRVKIAASVFLLLIASVLAWLFWHARQAPPAKPAEISRAQIEQAQLKRPDQPKAQPPAVQPPAVRPSPSPAATGPTPSKPAEYVLQTYSFRTSNKAEEGARQLKELNFPSFVVHHAGEDDDGWYVVYVGPFDDAEAARRTGSDLQAATGAAPVLRERVLR